MTDVGSLRSPNMGARTVMTRRAWWFVILTFLLPGSVQVIAGSRTLGRVGLWTTLVNWVAVIVAGILYLSDRAMLVGIVAQPWVLLVVQVYTAAWAILMVVLTLDTLRLVRLVRVAPASRWLVPLVALLVVALVGGGAGYASVQAGAARSLVSSVFGGTGSGLEAVDGRYNILLLGGDSGAGRWGLRPDSISLVSIDATTGATTIVGIPRNLQKVPFPESSPMHTLYPDGFDCGDECLINAVYTEAEDRTDLYPDAEAEGSSPGIEATKDAVEGVTGLEVPYFVLVNMEGFADLIDALGGVTITVDTRLELVDGDDDDVVSHGWIEAGTQHMDGQTALWYARSRKTTSDYDRMERQRNLEKAIIAQFDPLTIITKFQAVAAAGAATLETDLPSSSIQGLVSIGEKARAQTVTSVELTPDNGVVTANPDFAYIRSLVQQGIAGVATSSNGAEDG